MAILNTMFTSGMVLQAKKPIRVFGEGKGCVTVRFCGQSKTVCADGAWLLEFDPMEYGGPYEILVEHEQETTVLHDVWVGDVFLLSGQSNMSLTLDQTNHPTDRYEGSEYVRLYVVDKTERENIRSSDGWVPLTKENAKDFSAIGYHVALALANENRRIGLIGCNQGASVIQSWMPPEEVSCEKYRVEEKTLSHTKYPFNGESFLFNYMTSKILPYSLHSVLWYQGESNASPDESRIYLSLLEGLITSWRARFQDRELPFVVVQLADFWERDTEAWHTIQDAQLKAQEVIPNVRTVVCRDVCETDDIHPQSKDILAKRIAALLDRIP